MEKLTQYPIKIFIFFLLITVSSCGENHSLKEETHSFSTDNSAWINTDKDFVMKDSNGISGSFTLFENNHEYSKSWSSFMGVTTLITYTEYQYQSFRSSYGTSLSASLTAGYPPYGDEIYLNIGNLGFAYDFKYQEVTRISWNSEYISKLMTDDAYENSENLQSTGEILESFTIDNTSYSDVLHFTLRDFENSWSEFMITDIYWAKNVGLVHYTLRNGISFNRHS